MLSSVVEAIKESGKQFNSLGDYSDYFLLSLCVEYYSMTTVSHWQSNPHKKQKSNLTTEFMRK